MVSLSVVGFPILVAILDAILKFAIEKVPRNKNSDTHINAIQTICIIKTLNKNFIHKINNIFSLLQPSWMPCCIKTLLNYVHMLQNYI